MAYGRGYRRRLKNSSPRTEPKSIDLTSLALPELKKILKSCQAYLGKKRASEEENQRISLVNKSIDARNVEIDKANEIANARQVEWRKINCGPYEDQLTQINKSLEECRVGLIGQLIGGDHVAVGPHKYKRIPGESLLKQQADIYRKLASARESEPKKVIIDRVERQPYKDPPSREVNLKLGGATIRIDLERIDLKKLEELIDIQNENKEQENHRIHELKARAAASEKETRQQAQKFKRDLHKQLAKVPACPYCGGQLTDGDAHLDHIYPVSKGGQSTSKNLVFVCSRCNLNKKAMTLRAFIQQFGLDQLVVYQRLETLKKDA